MMNTTRNEATLNELLSAVRDYGTACTAWESRDYDPGYGTACVEAFAAVRRIAERIIEPSELDKRDVIDRIQREYLTKEHREGDA